MAYQLWLDFGAGFVEYTDSLYGRYPMRRQRAIYNELKPVISTVKFSLIRNTALVTQLLTTSADIPVRILDGETPYFVGYVRPTVKATVDGSCGLEAIEIEAVDLWYKLDRTISVTRTITGWPVSDPSNKAVSLLHRLLYDAGIADSELSLAAVSAVVPSVTVTAGSGTYRAIIEQLLSEAGYSARVSAAGVVSLYDLGPASITPALTLSSGPGGNLATGYTLERKEATAEAVDVEYHVTKALTDVMLFEDTTGATAGLDASISVPAGTYYPEGAASGKSVKAAMRIDGYDLVSASDITSDIAYNGALTIEEFTGEGKNILMRLYSASGAVITRLRGYGDAIVKGDLRRVVRENVASTTKREKVEFKYLADDTSASRVARIRAARHLHCAFRWSMTTTEMSLTPGDYVSLNEAAVLGASTTLRIVSVVDGPDPKTISIEAEGVAAYTADAVATETETNQPPSPSPSAEIREAAMKASIELAQKTLTVSAPSISRSRAGVLSPAAVTASGKNADGTAYAGRLAFALTHDGYNYRGVYVSAADESSHEYTVPADAGIPDCELALSSSNLPEYPDNAAGTTYLGKDFVDADGWLVPAGKGSVSAVDGVLRFTKTAANGYCCRDMSVAAGETVRIKVRYVPGSGVPQSYYLNVINTWLSSPTIVLPSNGEWVTLDATANSSGPSIGMYLGNFTSVNTYAIDIAWAYVGTGSYLTKAADLSGNGNDAQIFGATPVDGGFSFDGVNDYLKSTYTNSTYYGDICFWYKSTQATQGAVIETRNSSGVGSMAYYNINAEWFVDNSSARTPLPSDGLWHFVRLRPSVASINIQSIWLGRSYAGTSYLNCSIRNPRIYNRALTATEISWLAEHPDDPPHAYTSGVRASLYAAGGTTTLLREVTVPVSLDSSASAIYWGAMTTAPASGMIAGDYYFDSNLISAGGGYIRYYDGSLWVQATSSWPYYAEARAKAVDDIVSWVTTNPGSSSDLVTYIQAFIIDLWTYDLTVGRTLRVGGRYATDGTVADEDAVGVYQAADGTFKVGSPKGEFIVDATTGDVQIVDLPLRSYTGEGVQRRAVQIDNEAMDWLDCPDTTPATPERLRARIGRLGVGGSILLDGEFAAGISSTAVYGGVIAGTAETDVIGYSVGVILANGDEWIFYYRVNAGGICRKIRSGGVLGSETLIVSGASEFDAVVVDDVVSLIYKETSSNNIYIKEYNGSWGASISLGISQNATTRGNISVFSTSDGSIHILWNDQSTGYLKHGKINAGSVVNIETIVNDVDIRSSGVEDSYGNIRIAYTKAGVWDLYEKIHSGSWGAATLIAANIFDIGKYLRLISGELLLTLVGSNGRGNGAWIIETSDNEWGTIRNVFPAEELYELSAVQNKNGQVVIFCSNSSYVLVTYILQRYARVGAGIIESGYVSGRGWYVKYGDGTMIQRGIFNLGTSGGTDFTSYIYFPVAFINTDYTVSALPFDSYHGLSLLGASAMYSHPIGADRFWFAERQLGSIAAGYAAYISWGAIGRWNA